MKDWKSTKISPNIKHDKFFDTWFHKSLNKTITFYGQYCAIKWDLGRPDVQIQLKVVNILLAGLMIVANIAATVISQPNIWDIKMVVSVSNW